MTEDRGREGISKDSLVIFLFYFSYFYFFSLRCQVVIFQDLSGGQRTELGQGGQLKLFPSGGRYKRKKQGLLHTPFPQKEAGTACVVEVVVDLYADALTHSLIHSLTHPLIH